MLPSVETQRSPTLIFTASDEAGSESRTEDLQQSRQTPGQSEPLGMKPRLRAESNPIDCCQERSRGCLE